MNSEHTDYGWLFKEQTEAISGDIVIDLAHLPPELKQAALQILLHQIDRDTAEKKLAELPLNLILPLQNCPSINLNRAMPVSLPGSHISEDPQRTSLLRRDQVTEPCL